MQDLYQSLSKSTEYLSSVDKKCLREAFEFASQSHKDQSRKTGQPYITHPVEVAKFLAEIHLDRDSLISALLHDVVEDTRCDLQQIENLFGEKVAIIVDGVSRLQGYHYTSEDQEQAVNFSKMLVAMAKDMRVILIKLADRINNMKTVSVFSTKKRRRIAHETLEIYVPLAANIGLNSWRITLENQCFSVLYPNRYEVFSRATQNIKGNRQTLVDKTLETFCDELTQNSIQFIDVSGREKSPYSVFRKMRHKKVKFEQLRDLFGFRVVVNNVDDCYRALGVLHRVFRPIPGRFKDYIALPKPNGYQSLHTVLMNQQGIMAEVQIRSQAMHYNAEYGIAAHWIYKSDHLKSGDSFVPTEWLSDLLDFYQGDTATVDFLEMAKIDLRPKEIFVFTPRGKLINLPFEATAIDFAYAIHSKVGNRAIACQINQERAELNTHLENGDMINIVTNVFASPNPEWINFSKTAKARHSIRVHLRQSKERDLLNLGKQLFQIHLEKYNLSLEKIPKYALQTLLEELKVDSVEKLLLDIGSGSRFSLLVSAQIADIMGKKGVKNPRGDHSSNQETSLIITGSEGVAVQFARCCGPIHGDCIMGYLSLDKGLVIHRQFCPNVRQFRKHRENWISVSWNEAIKPFLNTRLRIQVEKGAGILAQVSNIIYQKGVDIIDIDVTREIATVVVKCEISVDSRIALAELIRSLRSTINIKKVTRLFG